MTDQGLVTLRPAPRAPLTMLGIGIVVGLVGAFILAVSADAAALGALVLAAGGVVATIGAVGQGVLMGSRVANYEEYLQRLIESGDDEDDGV